MRRLVWTYLCSSPLLLILTISRAILPGPPPVPDLEEVYDNGFDEGKCVPCEIVDPDSLCYGYTFTLNLNEVKDVQDPNNWGKEYTGVMVMTMLVGPEEDEDPQDVEYPELSCDALKDALTSDYLLDIVKDDLFPIDRVDDDKCRLIEQDAMCKGIDETLTRTTAFTGLPGRSCTSYYSGSGAADCKSWCMEKTEACAHKDQEEMELYKQFMCFDNPMDRCNGAMNRGEVLTVVFGSLLGLVVMLTAVGVIVYLCRKARASKE